MIILTFIEFFFNALQAFLFGLLLRICVYIIYEYEYEYMYRMVSELHENLKGTLFT